MPEQQAVNFMRGVPAPESFPLDEVRAASRVALEKHGATVLQYGAASGFAPLREWLARWQGVTAEQAFTANGSLQIVDLLCHALLRPGDLVFAESPTYDRTLTLLRRHQVRVVGLPLQADGLDLQALEAALRVQVPKLLYVIPDFQNPSGTTTSLAKRKELAALADRHGFWLLEDAPYRLLRYRGEALPTLFELAPACTLHMLSFSKLIGAGLRVGVLYGPPDLLARLAKVGEDTYITPSLLPQAIVGEFCAAGRLPAQVERLKALYAPRLEACLAGLGRFLPEVDAVRPDGGFFVSLRLPEGTSTARVREKARAHGLNLADGEAFFPDQGGERFLRLPFCALTPEEIDEGLRRLALAVRDAREAAA